MKYFINFVLPGILLLLAAKDFTIAQTVSNNTESDKNSILKAIFIYKVSKYVKWPSEIQRTPLSLCTLGNDPIVKAFSVISKEKAIRQSIQIKDFSNNLSPGDCHILYIASSEKENLRSLETIQHNKMMLTLSELPGFVQAGGIVELNYDKGKIQFEINLDVATKNQLKISSTLLKLANKVKWDSKR